MTHPLPPQGPHEPDDLLPGEAELRALYGKLPQNDPGPALDAAVLRAAAEAVSSQPTNHSATRHAAGKHGSRSRSWIIGLSSAATLVLAAGLAWRMRTLPQPDNSPPAVSEQVSTNAASKPTAQASRVSAPATRPPPPPLPARQPPPARVLDAARSLQSSKVVAERSKVQAAGKQATADRPTPPSAVATPAPAAANGVVMPTPRIQPQVTPAAPMPPAPPAPPAPAQPVAPAPAVMQEDEAAAQDTRPALAAELDAIRQLFAEHHEQEAQRRLEAFQRLHPQWPLPADLQARVRTP
jgi:hypothetical protein